MSFRQDFMDTSKSFVLALQTIIAQSFLIYFLAPSPLEIDHHQRAKVNVEIGEAKKVAVRAVLFGCSACCSVWMPYEIFSYASKGLDVNTVGCSWFIVLLVLFWAEIYHQVPNGIGAVLEVIQLVLYFWYSESSEELSRRPLLESYA